MRAWRMAAIRAKVLDTARLIWSRLDHLIGMNREQLAELGLERMLTTRELAEYLGVKVQAIYDLRADGRGPAGIPIGRELRYRVSDVRGWLDRMHEPDPQPTLARGEL